MTCGNNRNLKECTLKVLTEFGVTLCGNFLVHSVIRGAGDRIAEVRIERAFPFMHAVLFPVKGFGEIMAR